MTQLERVLALLQERGERGLNTVDLHAPACDGGKPILRLAARVRDLQDRGYRIRSERKLNGTATYFLLGVERGDSQPVSAPPQAGAGSPQAPAVASLNTERLFNSDEFKPPPGFYDVEVA